MSSQEWKTPKAAIIPKETSRLQRGKHGSVYPKTPASYGFIAGVKPGDTIRNHGTRRAKALESDSHILFPLELHYIDQMQ